VGGIVVVVVVDVVGGGGMMASRSSARARNDAIWSRRTGFEGQSDSGFAGTYGLESNYRSGRLHLARIDQADLASMAAPLTGVGSD